MALVLLDGRGSLGWNGRCWGAPARSKNTCGGIRRCFMSAGAASASAADAIAQAIKASGVIIHVEPDDFVGILKRQPGALVVHATGGFFSTSYKYLTSYKGL